MSAQFLSMIFMYERYSIRDTFDRKRDGTSFADFSPTYNENKRCSVFLYHTQLYCELIRNE